jgi:hypothetical protein
MIKSHLLCSSVARRVEFFKTEDVSNNMLGPTELQLNINDTDLGFETVLEAPETAPKIPYHGNQQTNMKRERLPTFVHAIQARNFCCPEWYPGLKLAKSTGTTNRLST